MPFDKPKAYLIIRSLDHVDFYVRKDILEKASPVFQDMLGLPQTEKSEKETSFEEGIPVIPLTEDSATLHILLQLCYPMATPIVDIGTIRGIIGAAKKYMMDGAMIMLVDRLQALIEENPYRVYAIAAHFRVEKVMVQAAKRSLRDKFPGAYCKDLEDFPAGDLHRLLEYRQRHSEIVKRTLDQPFGDYGSSPNFGASNSSWIWFNRSGFACNCVTSNQDFLVEGMQKRQRILCPSRPVSE